MLLWCKESRGKARLTRVSIESSYCIIMGLFKTYNENSNHDSKYLPLEVPVSWFFFFFFDFAKFVQQERCYADFSKTPSPQSFKLFLLLEWNNLILLHWKRWQLFSFHHQGNWSPDRLLTFREIEQSAQWWGGVGWKRIPLTSISRSFTDSCTV